MSDACDWLSDYLGAGARAARDVLRDARGAGINRGTLRRAKRLLGVHSVKSGKDSEWVWSQARVGVLPNGTR